MVGVVVLALSLLSNFQPESPIAISEIWNLLPPSYQVTDIILKQCKIYIHSVREIHWNVGPNGQKYDRSDLRVF